MEQELKAKIIGQTKLVNALIRFLKSNVELYNNSTLEEFSKSKKNCFISGSYGTGKTSIIELLKNKMDNPFIIINTRNLFDKVSISKVLSALLIEVDGDLSKLRNSIICFDNFEEILNKNFSISNQEEISNFIKGDYYPASYKDKDYLIDTSGFINIFIGTFKKPIFSKENLLYFGFDTPFIEKMDIILTTKSYTKDDYKDILLMSKISPLLEFVRVCKLFGIDVVYDDEFVDETCKNAEKLDLGANGLEILINKIKLKYQNLIVDRKINFIKLSKSENNIPGGLL